MDVEKTIEFILQTQARAEARAEIEHAQFLERQAEFDERLRKIAEEGARTDATLRRAIRLGVREARRERQRRQELDQRFNDQMAQLAAAQRVTEQKLQGLIESLNRRGNGHPS